ncbi:MAG: alpha/beta hydrolase [Promethearchaeia archaeon]
MDITTNIFSDKKRMALLIGLILFFSGLIPLIIFTFYADFNNPYTIKEIDLESQDGTALKALELSKNKENAPGIVVAHGFCGNKQYMQPLSIELVKRGFTVVAIDLRGHGSSDGYLSGLRRSHENNPLIGDMMAAVEYLEEMGISKIGLVGHSMGGRTSLLVSEEYPDKIEAMVSIGMIGFDYNFSKISNLMMGIGNFEQIFSKENAIEFLQTYTKKDEVEIGKLYGDFSRGDATKVVVGMTSEHLAEVLDSQIIYETVQWFEQAFNGERADDITITVPIHQVSFFICIAGVTLLSFLGVVYLKQYLFKREFMREKNQDFQDNSLVKIVVTYILGAALGFIIFLYPFSLFFMAVMPVSMGHILFASIVGMAIGFLFSYYFFFIRKNEELEWKSIPVRIKERIAQKPYKSLAYGIIVGIGMTLAISLIMHWSTNAALLTVREVGAVFGITLLFFPFLLVKEFYLRSLQEQLNITSTPKEYFSMVGLGILVDSLLIIGLGLLTWENPNSDLAFIALSMTAVFIIYVIQHFLVTWVYMFSGRNILGSTIFYCILYGWIIVNFFPFGINSGFF